MNDFTGTPRLEPTQQRIPSCDSKYGVGEKLGGGQRKSLFVGGGRRTKRRKSHQAQQQWPLANRLMPIIDEHESFAHCDLAIQETTMRSRLLPGSAIELSGRAEKMSITALTYLRLPPSHFSSGGFRQRRNRERMAIAAVCAIAALSCLSTGTSDIGRNLSVTMGRFLNLATCDKGPYISPEQAKEIPATPLPGAEMMKKGGAQAGPKREEYVPSHIAMCREFQRRYDATQGGNPDGEKFPLMVVREHEGVCASWEAPHFNLMEILASTFLSVYSKQYNLLYEHECSRTRPDSRASLGGEAIQRRRMTVRTAPHLSAHAAHLLEMSSLDFDATTIQQILSDVSPLLDRAKVTPEAEKEVLSLCQGCIQEHDALTKAGNFAAPKAESDNAQVSEEKAKEFQARMSHVTHECLLYPGGKNSEAATDGGGGGVALSTVRPVIVTLLRHAAIDWRKKAQGPPDEGREGAVIYLDDESSVMPVKVYADRIPQSAKSISILNGPLCGRRPDCVKKGTELVGFLSQLYPGTSVQLDIVASTAAANSRMVLAKHLIAPPGTISALLPAIAKPTGTFATVGESKAFGGSTAGWYGGGESKTAKVDLQWCVTPECRDEEVTSLGDGAKVGLMWGLPGEEHDAAKVGLAWGLPGQVKDPSIAGMKWEAPEQVEDPAKVGLQMEFSEAIHDPSKVGLQFGTPEQDEEESNTSKVGLSWGLPEKEEEDPSKTGLQLGSNVESLELSDDEMKAVADSGYVLSPEETKELETRWDRPVELKPATPQEEDTGLSDKSPPPVEPDPTSTEEKSDNSPVQSSFVYQPGSPPDHNEGNSGTSVFDSGSHSALTTTGSGAVGGCTHTRGRLGQWQADGTWRDAFPECATHILSLNGLCGVVKSLHLGRVMFIGDELQGEMVKSMMKMLGMGDIDPNSLLGADGVWKKHVVCPIQGNFFELVFARNDRIASQSATYGPAQYLNAGAPCEECSPWAQSYAAMPMRTFLVACPCAACVPEEGGGGRRGLKGLFSREGRKKKERELQADDVRSDVDRFLSLVRDIGRPHDVVFIRTMAPTYCKGSPRPDAVMIDAFNDRVHDAVFEWEWMRTHRGPPTTIKRKTTVDDSRGNTFRKTTAKIAPTYLLDVSPMTKAHPASAADEGIECGAASGEEGGHHDPVDYWNHLLYTSMIDLAKKEDPGFDIVP